MLLDADMPELSGEQFAVVLGQPAYDAVRPPVILLTDAGGPCSDMPGCVAQVLKTPVASGDLLDAVQRAVAGAAKPALPLALNVLLVEDNVINEKVAVALLEKRGCRVAVARDGEQALAALEQDRYDVVLMDMQMPVMDGLEATRRIRHREAQTGRSRTSVLAMTANAMAEDRAACLAAGMDDHIAKPIRPDELMERLRRLAA
jgi:CheY-like chemotaxis protein